ncbi:MarR family winged helix-turn-helix transcriptional regulator [Vibrio penaeicida]|uniref:MarR family winged helix-turn-helix transcriptional regulator n=1 Tax=Vibrio penaeicida TaxID=104609 RepID=UPI00191C7465|nr:MarR family transcriptional regulator [Vibrio penaeicida]
MSELKKSIMNTDEQKSKSRLRLWLRILGVSQTVQSELRQNFRVEFNSTLPRFDVLATLARYEEGMKMSDLSKALRVSGGNVTGIIDRLIEDEFVERAVMPNDRRASCVSLTELGRKEFEVQAKAHETWVNDLLISLDDESLDTLCQQLDDIIHHTVKD